MQKSSIYLTVFFSHGLFFSPCLHWQVSRNKCSITCCSTHSSNHVNRFSTLIARLQLFFSGSIIHDYYVGSQLHLNFLILNRLDCMSNSTLLFMCHPQLWQYALLVFMVPVKCLGSSSVFIVLTTNFCRGSSSLILLYKFTLWGCLPTLLD